MAYLTEEQNKDLFQTISKTAAKALQDAVEALKNVKTAADMAEAAAAVHRIAFKAALASAEWMNAERKPQA